MSLDHEIPVLDLQDPEIISKLQVACESYGFFYLKNHGISLEPVFEQSERFFQLELEKKMTCLQNSYHFGYTIFGDETVNPEEQTEGDTKEGYYISTEPKSIDEVSKNVWPSSELLPNWKNVMVDYHCQCSNLGFRLAQLIFQCYNISDELLHACFDNPTALLRLLRYGKILSDPSIGRYGAGPHSDYGLITILATRPHQPGLEIYYDSRWIPVTLPDPSWLVINLGDSLQRLTNNTIRSTIHRVLITDNQQFRHSIPFFYEPNNETIISCLDQFVTPEKPKQYEPIRYGEYLRWKYEITDTQKIEMKKQHEVRENETT